MSSRRTEGSPAVGRGVPLVVDLDRAVLGTDLLWEGLVRILVDRPGRLFSVLAELRKGPGPFRARVAEVAGLDLERVPTRSRVEEMVRAAGREGRSVLLLSATPRPGLERLARRLGADGVVSARQAADPSGRGRLAAIRERAEVFDFVGDDAPSPAVLRAARRAHLVEPSDAARRIARESDTVLEPLADEGSAPGAALLRALRPHQWAKNGLLLLPILAAHLRWDAALIADVATGLASFSFLASAVYLANDLADLPHDRLHEAKRERPLAAGDLTVPAAVAAMLGLIAAAALLAVRLPGAFQAALAAYLVLNVAYSWGLKRLLALDVILLAGLYTVRVVAGAALARIELTGWFLAFSIFLFLSLAVLKRVVEMESVPEDGLSGRAYRAGDLPVLRTIGPACGVMAALVYCLYITGPVRELYRRPDVLWLGLPLLLYWVVRIWLLALRGEVDEDPVVFVVRDGISYLTLLAFLGVVFLAS